MRAPDGSHDSLATLLVAARSGEERSLGELLERYRGCLRAAAQAHIDLQLAVRSSPSDVVQETFLRAAEHFAAFRGNSEAELLAWLRRILARSIVNAYVRHVQSAKRDVRCERPLAWASGDGDRSHFFPSAALATSDTSPSLAAARSEYAEQVAQCLAQLPPAAREVVVLRNFEGLPFDDIAVRLGKSSEAVRKIWSRAIRQLRLPPWD